MTNQATLGSLFTAAEQFTPTASIAIGNSTVNAFVNSTIIQVGNSTAVANLTPLGLSVGNTVINTTAVAIGTFSLTPGVLVFGNSTSNVSVNSTLIAIGNSAGAANLTQSFLRIGNTVVNSSIVTLNNGTNQANLTGLGLVVGPSVVNSGGIIIGSNVALSPSGITVGNATANVVTLPAFVQVANGAGLANLVPNSLQIGNTTVNTTVVQLANGDGQANLSATLLSIGSSNVGGSGVVVGASVINTSAISTITLFPTQISANGSVGTPGQSLTSNGAGTFWASAPSLAPAGANTNIIFNDSGVYGGSANFAFDKNLVALGIGPNLLINANAISVNGSVLNSTALAFNSALTTLQLTPTGLVLGANVLLSPMALTIVTAGGNSALTSSLLTLKNPVGTANLTPVQLQIGNTIVNTSGISVTGSFTANGNMGAFGKFLTSNGTGAYWDYPPSSTPPGANTQVTFNDSGAYGASPGLSFDKTLGGLTVGNVVTIGSVVANTSAVRVGANVLVNTTVITVGGISQNGSAIVVGANVFLNTQSLSVGPNVFLNTQSLSIGNSTVEAFVNSSVMAVPSIQITGSLAANGSVGAGGQFLGSDGSRAFWGAVPPPIPPGANTQIMFNDSGVLGTNTLFFFSKDTTSLAIGGAVINGQSMSIGANTFVNTTAFAVGNNQAKFFTNSTVLSVGSVWITGGLSANGLLGSSGQILATDSTKAYWTNPTSIAGLQTTAGLAANVATLGYQSISGMSAYQQVSGMSAYQTVALMSNYQTLGGLAANVATLGYQTVSGMSSYQTVSGMSSYQTLAGLAANVATLGYAKLGVADQTITGGAIVTPLNLGSISSGTVTIDMGARPAQTLTVTGSLALTPGANNGSCLLDVGVSSGTVTPAGWTKVSGDTFSSGNYRCHCSVSSLGSLLVVQALQ